MRRGPQRRLRTCRPRGARPRRRVDKFFIDAHAVPVALRRTFEHVANAKLSADFLRVDGLALESESRLCARSRSYSECATDRSSNSVGEIVLGGIVGKIDEWQDDDREMGSLGRPRRVAGDGRGRPRPQEMPGAGQDDSDQARPDPESSAVKTFRKTFDAGSDPPVVLWGRRSPARAPSGLALTAGPRRATKKFTGSRGLGSSRSHPVQAACAAP